jgi:hypothetical protein
MTAWRARSTASSAERVVSAHRILRRRVDHCRRCLGRLHGRNRIHPRVLRAGVPHKRREPTRAIRHLDLVPHFFACALFACAFSLVSRILLFFYSFILLFFSFFFFFFWAIFFGFFSFVFSLSVAGAQSRPRRSFRIGLHEMTREGQMGPIARGQGDKRTIGQENQGSRFNWKIFIET